MEFKRITILCGHYGSGKTNVAIALAREQKHRGRPVIIADLDIVNPYFRTQDSEEELAEEGIRMICSSFANSNVDLPSLPQEIYAVTDDSQSYFVLDVGGDERGALALGRLAPEILRENDYDMYMVVNRYRPLTPDAASTMEVLREIETASGLHFTGIINNSNLARETTPETVLQSLSYARSIAAESGLPLIATTVEERIYEAVKAEIAGAGSGTNPEPGTDGGNSASGNPGELFPIRLQKKPV